MALWYDFGVEAVAGLVGVFAGVLLALATDRRARARDERGRQAETLAEFDRAKEVVLGSVVKNVAQAKRIKSALEKSPAQALLEPLLEVSVWDAVRDQFVRHCPTVDERILFAQFFDAVGRLRSFAEFHRGLQTSITANALPRDDPELTTLLAEAADQLTSRADELRLTGVMLVNDFGAPVHKRMLGLAADEPSA